MIYNQLICENTNIYKNTDYGKPLIHQNTDYRTSSSHALHRKHSSSRNFLPDTNSESLCNLIKSNIPCKYNPQSETTKEFQWKINRYRSIHREDLAPSLKGVQYLHQFANKIKLNVIKPLSDCKTLYRDQMTFKQLPRNPPISTTQPFKYEMKKITHFTNTAGYFPMADPMVSTTTLDYIPYSNYNAKTTLITRNDMEFNSNTPIVKKHPMSHQYPAMITRDKSKFPFPIYNRIVPRKSKFVPNHGLTTEMTSKY
ncbi:unnamed protein product [Diamesa serratosioi]